MTTPTSRVPVGPHTFDVTVDGADDADPILLLHGFPQTSSCWRRVRPALVEAGLRVIAPGLRGYSPDARPLDPAAYRIEILVDDVLALADHFGARRFHLVGHDWGGALAWHLAGRHPERIRTLTVLSTPH